MLRRVGIAVVYFECIIVFTADVQHSPQVLADIASARDPLLFCWELDIRWSTMCAALMLIVLYDTRSRLKLSQLEDVLSVRPLQKHSSCTTFAAAEQRLILAHPNTKFRVWGYSVSNPSVGHSSTRSHDFLLGSAVDELKVVLSYLPPRRICDRYRITGDNLYSLVQWYEFACEHGDKANPSLPTEESEALIVKFVETIQAKGCNSIWESMQSTTSKDIVHQAKAFLSSLRHEGACVTEDIRLFYVACLPSHDRRFGLTAAGRFCLLPFGAIEGDVAYSLEGSKVPVVLRPLSDLGGKYWHENVG